MNRSRTSLCKALSKLPTTAAITLLSSRFEENCRKFANKFCGHAQEQRGPRLGPPGSGDALTLGGSFTCSFFNVCLQRATNQQECRGSFVTFRSRNSHRFALQELNKKLLSWHAQLVINDDRTDRRMKNVCSRHPMKSWLGNLAVDGHSSFKCACIILLWSYSFVNTELLTSDPVLVLL